MSKLKALYRGARGGGKSILFAKMKHTAIPIFVPRMSRRDANRKLVRIKRRQYKQEVKALKKAIRESFA